MKRIVEAHHGSVAFEAPAEGGARFVLRIPARAPRAPLGMAAE